jgi:ribosome-binding factor A
MRGFRKERVGETLLSFLASELRTLTDPRLANITLTDVDISPDLKVARVYWTTHAASLAQSNGIDPKSAEGKERAEVEEALRSAKKLLKARIGKELKFRYTPDLDFRFDDSISRGFYIDSLLKNG